MQTAASQVQWIPVEDILIPESDWEDDEPNGAVHVVPRLDGRYQLLCGSAALRRMREAGQLCADALVSPPDRMERRISKLLDQLVRGEMHYLDEAESFRILLRNSGWTVKQLAQRLGRTPATLSRKMRLLELDEETRRVLRANEMCESYAQVLLRIPGRQGRLRILRHAVQQGLGVKELEKLIDDVLSRMPIPQTGGQRMKPLMRDYRLYVNAIRGIVEQMEDAGLAGNMQVAIGRQVAEVRVNIPIFSKAAR